MPPDGFADHFSVSSFPIRYPLPHVRAARPVLQSLGFALERLIAWLERPRRVLIVLALVWVINFFDLNFTLIESQRHFFKELNPVAAPLLHSSSSLVLYKAALILIASVILLSHARQRIAELGAWLALSIYGYVGCCWWLYYGHVSETLNDPVVYMSAITP